MRKGTTPIPLRVVFTASDPSGVAATRLQHRISGRAYSGVPLPSNKATKTVVRVGASSGTTHRFRGRAWDRMWNASPFAVGAAFRVRVVQSGARTVKRNGSWVRTSARSLFGGSAHQTGAAGASRKLTTVGTDFAVVSTKGPNRGKAAIMVDGKRVAVVDLYAAKSKPRTVVWATSYAKPGKHTVVLKALGTKNRKSRGKRIDLDAFLVLTKP